LDYDEVGGADLVVEAVVERMAVKQQVLREAESAAPAAVLATNTSSLSVDEMASGVERPGSVLGLHFFNPVHKMPLVEVVAGPRTTSRSCSKTSIRRPWTLDCGTPATCCERPRHRVSSARNRPRSSSL
jgi:3-hydroxyacyl-CoA dehydrogenase